jgi:predicted permease
MTLLLVIIDALVPIAFVILLGVLAGRSGLIAPSVGGAFSVAVLDFCLPAQLFNATATMSTTGLPDWQFCVAIAIGLLAVYLVALGLALTLFHRTVDASSLQALNASFPNVAFIGIPVLTAVIGKSAVIPAVVGILISSLLLPPITLVLLAAGSPEQKGHTGVALIWGSVLGAVKQPLIWAPVLGIVFVLAHIPLPDVAQKSLTLIGEATSGLALFAMGLLLSGQKLRASGAVWLNVVFKNLAQPGAMWLLGLLLGVTGEHLRAMVLMGALPTAPATAMFAMKYNVYTDESEATILLSTVACVLTLGAIIALTG